MIINNIPCESAFIIDSRDRIIAAISEDEAMVTKDFRLILSSDPENDLRIIRDNMGNLIIKGTDEYNSLS